MLVTLSAPAGGVAGVDIGHGHVRVAVADRTGQVLAEELALVDVDSHGVRGARPGRPDGARRRMPAAGLAMTDLHAVGMCVPAPLDRRSAKVSTGILPGLARAAARRGAGAPARRSRSSPTTTPTSAPWPSSTTGSPGARSDMLYVKVASGLGAGIVLGGRLHRGTSGIAGEIGHVQVGRGRPGLPLRQPRLPRDRGRGAAADRAAPAGVRRRALHRRTCWSSTPPATPPYAGC